MYLYVANNWFSNSSRFVCLNITVGHRGILQRIKQKYSSSGKICQIKAQNVNFLMKPDGTLCLLLSECGWGERQKCVWKFHNFWGHHESSIFLHWCSSVQNRESFSLGNKSRWEVLIMWDFIFWGVGGSLNFFATKISPEIFQKQGSCWIYLFVFVFLMSNY